MCWNKACTTPCAELGKQDFLFPEKSSYIRLWTKRQSSSPKPPSHCRIPPRHTGFRVPVCLLTLTPPPGWLLPTPPPSKGLCQHLLNVPRPPRGRAPAPPSQGGIPPEEEVRLLGKGGHFCCTLGGRLIFSWAVCLSTSAPTWGLETWRSPPPSLNIILEFQLCRSTTPPFPRPPSTLGVSPEPQ